MRTQKETEIYKGNETKKDEKRGRYDEKMERNVKQGEGEKRRGEVEGEK